MKVPHTDETRLIYISGPMRGFPDFNYPKFNAVEEELTRNGWHVDNPAKIGEEFGTPEEIRESMQELSLHQYCGEYHCDVCALEERNAKLREYERILVLEEVRGAMEKQKAKKPIHNDKCTCPSCGTHNEVFKKRRNTVAHDIVYCWHCGQAIKIFRSDEE